MPLSTVTITQLTDTVTQGHVRQHTVLIDKPTEGGGTDEGAKARELFLMSYGACFMKNLQAAIKGRNAAISDVEVDVVGTATDRPNKFTDIELRVSAVADDATQLEKLVTISERGCLLANTLRDSVNLTFTVTQRVVE